MKQDKSLTKILTRNNTESAAASTPDSVHSFNKQDLIVREELHREVDRLSESYKDLMKQLDELKSSLDKDKLDARIEKIVKKDQTIIFYRSILIILAFLFTVIGITLFSGMSTLKNWFIEWQKELISSEIANRSKQYMISDDSQ